MEAPSLRTRYAALSTWHPWRTRSFIAFGPCFWARWCSVLAAPEGPHPLRPLRRPQALEASVVGLVSLLRTAAFRRHHALRCGG